jgi:hypothetical protein
MDGIDQLPDMSAATRPEFLPERGLVGDHTYRGSSFCCHFYPLNVILPGSPSTSGDDPAG